MMTKFGKKTKPLLKVIEWRNSLDDEGAPVSGDGPSGSSPKLVQSAADMDDEIPW
jgi:hypothetical protein